MYRKKNYNKNNNCQNRTKEMFENIVNKFQEIIKNGDYKKFLRFQKSFRHYSFNNLVLIFSQFPDATMVAGKSKWQKLKREIIKGSKKIWIIAPISRQYDKTVKVIKDGEEVKEIVTIQYNTYRYVYVYDISQTTGEDIPLKTQNLNNDDMAYFYNMLKSFCNLPILEEKMDGSKKGYYNTKKKYIAIKSGLSFNDKAAVLLHELAHALYDDFDYSKDRNLSEVFVESIAYIVADHFGLDTSPFSFNYIIKWAEGDPNIILDLGNKIQKCANEFIEKLEECKNAQEKLVA